jgi:hypothetical protein
VLPICKEKTVKANCLINSITCSERRLIGCAGSFWVHFSNILTIFVAHGSVVVKALCYKPDGRGFDTRWGDFLNLPNPSGRTRPWGLLSL